MLPKSVLLPLEVVMDIYACLTAHEASDPTARRLADVLEAKFKALIAREEYTERQKKEG